eukprot:COSAG01_NODE_1695_length_9464_cov_4.884677_10_plen_174_part_00
MDRNQAALWLSARPPLAAPRPSQPPPPPSSSCRRFQQLTKHVAGRGRPPTSSGEAAVAAATAGPKLELIRVCVGPYNFVGHLEPTAPKTCALFRSLLPHRDKIIQARWSGFAAWIPSPLGAGATMPVLPPENSTAIPLPGQILFYPGGISEVEILFPCKCWLPPPALSVAPLR